MTHWQSSLYRPGFESRHCIPPARRSIHGSNVTAADANKKRDSNSSNKKKFTPDLVRWVISRELSEFKNKKFFSIVDSVVYSSADNLACLIKVPAPPLETV